MEKNKYIEALDTLIRFYQGKIAELEAMKLDVISESTEEKPEVERRAVDIVTYFDYAQNRALKRIKYDDGTHEVVEI